MKTIELNVNGKDYKVEVDGTITLAKLLRDELGLMGTKVGCGEGECGACTVMMDGETVLSCLILAFQADGSKIITIEGVGGKTGDDIIQQAFIEVGAVQCGFCIPGMILSAKTLLNRNLNPTEEEIREAISEIYADVRVMKKIVEAIKLAADRMRKGENSDE